MIIECSNCKKKFKIQADRLPKDKIVAFPCKNCGEKLRLDLRTGHIINEKSNGSEPSDTDSAPKPQPENETDVTGLRDKILKSVKELPAMPQVVIKAQELIADSKADAKKIAGIIETDQSIATKVLKVANSSYYGMSGKISSISHASVVLGLEILGEIVTLAGAEGILDGKLPGYGYDSKDLWKHSLAVAFGSKIIANLKNPDLAKEAHMAGLIHDVGKIILDCYIVEKKEEIESFLEKQEKTFLRLKVNISGSTMRKLHLKSAKNGTFPNHSISHSSTITDLETRMVTSCAYILHMADYIAILSGIGYDSDDTLYELEEGTMNYLNITNEDVSKIVLKVTESVNKISI